jgi:hypothetical protein
MQMELNIISSTFCVRWNDSQNIFYFNFQKENKFHNMVFAFLSSATNLIFK